MSDRLARVVVPVFNGAAFVEGAVRSALAQTYRDLEVVVVNDGSTDDTPTVVERLAAEDPRVRVVHQENRGLSEARNAGIAASRGAYLAFLDADDWLTPTKFATQVTALDAEPEIDLVYGEVRYVDVAAGRTWDPLRGAPPLPFERLLVYRNWFAPPAPLLRRRLVERVGGFDPGFRAVEDWDYWLRCLRHTEFRFVAGVVARYRLHPGQMHRDRPRMEQAHRRLVDKHFADDRTARRRHEAFRRLSDAMAARSSGAIGRAVWDLMRFLGSAGSPAEARVVWDLARRHPVPVREDDDGGRGHAGA